MQQVKADASLRPVVGAALTVARRRASRQPPSSSPTARWSPARPPTSWGPPPPPSSTPLKRLAGIDHEHHLISREAIEPIQTVKVKHLGSANPRLHSDETLIALAISATTNPLARQALDQLSQLRDCEAHASVILSAPDSGTYAKLGMRLTCEPTYETNKLYHR